MLDLGIVRPGSTVRIPFSSFDKDDGSSITMTNFATSDILIYKDGSTTERASTAGFTATTDFDAKTGKHVAIIDLADNTTSGFYNSGSEYMVAIDAVTIDAVTTGGWIARFRIGYVGAMIDTTIATLSSQTSFTLTAGPAEDDAINGCSVIIHDIASAVQCGLGIVSDYTGSTKTVTLVAGTTFTAAAGDNISVMFPQPMQPTVAGRTLDVSSTGEAGVDWANVGSPTTSVGLSNTTVGTATAVTTVNGLAANTITATSINSGAITSAKFAAGAIDAAAIADNAIDLATFAADAKALLGVVAFGTAQSVGATSIQLASAETFASSELVGATVLIRSATTGAGQARVITAYNGGTDTATVDTWTTTPTGTVTYVVFATPPASTASPMAVNVTQFGGTAGTFASGIPEVKVASIAANAITATSIAADAITDAKVASDVTIASVTGAVGSVTGNVGGNVVGSVASVTAGVTVTTNNDKTGYRLSATGVDDIWDEATSGHTTAGTTGKALTDAGSAGDPWSTALPGAYGAGTAGYLIGTNVDAPISTVDTVVDAIKAKTDSLTFTSAGKVDSNIKAVNNVTVNGTGAVGDEWGP